MTMHHLFAYNATNTQAPEMALLGKNLGEQNWGMSMQDTENNRAMVGKLVRMPEAK